MALLAMLAEAGAVRARRRRQQAENALQVWTVAEAQKDFDHAWALAENARRDGNVGLAHHLWKLAADAESVLSAAICGRLPR